MQAMQMQASIRPKRLRVSARGDVTVVNGEPAWKNQHVDAGGIGIMALFVVFRRRPQALELASEGELVA